MSRGRQRVDMARITNNNNLQVTFSKRRSGLFKKAGELCTLTGSELAVVVFSPGNKLYSFGSPSVNHILEKFESQTPLFTSPSDMVNEAQRQANDLSLNQQLQTMEELIDTTKKRSDELSEMVNVNQNQHWWQTPINELNMEQLAQLKIAYEELDRRVQIQAQKGLPPNAIFSANEFQPPPPPTTIDPNVPSIHNGPPFAVDHQKPSGSGTNFVPFNDPNASG